MEDYVVSNNVLTSVPCVYRLHEQGEILQGTFNVLEGRLNTIPFLMKVDLSMYRFIAKDYFEHNLIGYKELVNKMCEDINALVVINYDNFGFIVIARDYHYKYLPVPQTYSQRISTVTDTMNFEIRAIGYCRTVMLTRDVRQDLAYLVVDTFGKRPVIHTRFGPKVVPDEILNANVDASILSKRYAEMCRTPDVYGMVVLNGEAVFVGANRESDSLFIIE